jgi:hypothetical protein
MVSIWRGKSRPTCLMNEATELHADRLAYIEGVVRRRGIRGSAVCEKRLLTGFRPSRTRHESVCWADAAGLSHPMAHELGGSRRAASAMGACIPSDIRSSNRLPASSRHNARLSRSRILCKELVNSILQGHEADRFPQAGIPLREGYPFA